MSNATYYDQFTTRVEVACQAGVCYHSPDFLQDKTTQLDIGNYKSLLLTKKKSVIDAVEQEYLAYLFINNSNAKMHNQLKKDVANDYFKGNTEAYPSNIHKALTLMNEYKPFGLDAPIVAAQDTAFVIKSGRGGENKGAKKYLPEDEWNALSAEEKSKLIES